MCIYNGPMPETSESLLTFKGSLKMFQNLNDKYALKIQEISARPGLPTKNKGE